MVEEAKKSYYQDKIKENKNNPKKLWKSLNQLGISNKLKTKANSISLEINGNITSDRNKVANDLNYFFPTVADKLVKQLPDHSGKFGESHIQVHSFYKKKGIQVDTFGLAKVSEDKMIEKLAELSCSKATGLDNIPARFLKDAADSIGQCITHIQKVFKPLHFLHILVCYSYSKTYLSIFLF